MKTNRTGRIRRAAGIAAATLMIATLIASNVHAQGTCTTALIKGLSFPLGITQSNRGNLFVAETGVLGVLHSGRISIVGTDGSRRTLIDGLPSATNDVNEPSGPAGVVMRGRTLYVAIGIGDAILPVGTTPFRIANPTPSSPLFSSVLAIHFSANVERRTLGFSLTTSDHKALARGKKVKLSHGHGDSVTVELVANFPDFVPDPLPPAPDNVRGSNPFGLEIAGLHLFVTDGGRNLVWRTNIFSGAVKPLATFAAIPNPTDPVIGPPVLDAVPTGIREFDGHLFVTLFRGFPFPPGASVVEQIDPWTGRHAPFVTGLRSAIDVEFADDEELASLVVLQHATGGLLPPFSGPGTLTRWDTTGPKVLADCLGRPTSMVRDERTGAIYITELTGGRVSVVP